MKDGWKVRTVEAGPSQVIECMGLFWKKTADFGLRVTMRSENQGLTLRQLSSGLPLQFNYDK